MNKFTKVTSTGFPIKTENIDTDQIIPARFLKTTQKEGLGKYLFYDKSFDLNDCTSKILIAGNNFGCGSSREHAVWAIMDFGFRVVISSSFGDIFYNNALKNGLLPAILKPAQLNKLFRIVENKPKTKITVDLEKQQITTYKEELLILHFPIDSFRKTCLSNGVDELGYILSFQEKIREFERLHQNFISA